MEKFELSSRPNKKAILDMRDYEMQNPNDFKLNKKIPFDMFLMNYIFSNESSYDVRLKALQVLIKNFNQRDYLVKELSRTDIIVSRGDFDIYFNFL